jgi:hypothetical protein
VVLPIPLGVRLATSRDSMTVTRQLRDLSFRSVAPGGFASATIALDRPLALQPDEIAYYGRLYVYDLRNGKTVWEGRVEDPGRTADDSGEVWELAAIGPSGHAHDRTIPIIYIDTRLNVLRRVDDTKPGFETAAPTPIPFSDPNQGIVMRLPQGLSVNVGDSAAMSYQEIRYTGQKIARVSAFEDAGGVNNNWQLQLLLGTNVTTATGDVGDAQTMTTASAGINVDAQVVTDFNNGRNVLTFLFWQVSGGAVTATNDLHWASWQSIFIRSMLMTATGSDITTGYTNDYVRADEVVKDLLGRVLTQYDGALATVTTTSYQHSQLAYPDGADAGKILDDLINIEPTDYCWAAWESTINATISSPKYRFEFIPWPATVRYEASTLDGYRSQGSADGLFNAARVRYVDARGDTHVTQLTSSVPELAAAGLTREGFVDLGSEAASAASATAAGNTFLADHSSVLNAGTLTIARPILDRTLGRMVMPWEIRPGQLIRVRGILPKPDGLNATARNGVTVFRIVGTNFKARDAAVDLDLDSYQPTLARQVVEQQTKVRHGRRR